MKGKWTMIDNDTPQDAYTLDSYTESGKQLQLVFSDEFNTDYRTFYPGDDPFWEAVDLHYWGVSALSRAHERVADLPSRRTTSNGMTLRRYVDLET